MKIIALMLAAALLFAPAALADTTADLLAKYGLSESDAAAFAALVETMGADLTAEDIESLMNEFLGSEGAERLEGTLTDDRYTHPDGVSFTIPEGWSVLEGQLGATAMLMGDPDEDGFAPTIGVLVLNEAQPEFETATQEYWDEELGALLENYVPMGLEAFEFLDVTAHELVLMHGGDEDNMLIQYQLYFNKDERACIITLTARADEAAHYAALDVYDAFLSGFEISPKGVG